MTDERYWATNSPRRARIRVQQARRQPFRVALHYHPRTRPGDEDIPLLWGLRWAATWEEAWQICRAWVEDARDVAT